MKKKTLQTKKLTQLALLTAILIVFDVVGIGIIKIPPVAITIMHIPVIIGAITMGPLYGGILGGVFGIISMLEAMRSPNPVDQLFSPFGGSPNPLASLFLVMVPRILLGVLAGYLFKWFEKFMKKSQYAIGLSAGISTLFHSAAVLTTLAVAFKALPLKEVFMTVISINGIIELILGVVLTILIAKPLIKYLKNS